PPPPAAAAGPAPAGCPPTPPPAPAGAPPRRGPAAGRDRAHCYAASGRAPPTRDRSWLASVPPSHHDGGAGPSPSPRWSRDGGRSPRSAQPLGGGGPT